MGCLQGKPERSAETPEYQHQRMGKDQISVVILGNQQSLKKALITNILGKDLTELTKKKTLTNTMVYENETFVFSCSPDLRIPCDDITELLSRYPPSDMCLLVVEDGFSTEHVQQQIEDLQKKTGKPAEQFTVVLPMRHKPTDYPFKSCTLEQLIHEVDKVAKDKKTTGTRSVLSAQSQSASAPHHITSKSMCPPGDVQQQKKHHSQKTETGSADDTNTVTESELLLCRSAEKPEVAKPTKTKGKLTDTTVNLVLLGMSGTGKSSSGNTILGKRVFTSKPSSRPITTECQVAETEINGTRVRVIDTPDMFDDDLEASVRDRHVRRCRELFVAGPSVFVLVMQVSRFTDGERDVLRKLEKAFGNKVREETVILFTRGDDLQQAHMSLEEFLHSCQPELKEIIHACGCRCVLFENRSSSSDQVKDLMDTVLDTLLDDTAKRQ